MSSTAQLATAMNRMQFKRAFLKWTFLCWSFVLFCSFQKLHTVTENKPQFSARVSGWERKDNTCYVSLKTTLTNTSADTIQYLSMSCSWQDAYTTDTKILRISTCSCNKNIPVVVTIPPHSKRETLITCTSNGSISQLKALKFSIGFHFIAAGNGNELSARSAALTAMKNMIWSEVLRLPATVH